jgi:uncharacterized membrane protein
MSDIVGENADRLLYLLVGVLMLRLAFRLWGVLAPQSITGVVVLLYLVATSLGLFVIAVADIDMERWGTWIGLWVAFVLASAAGAIVMLRPESQFGTDALLFSSYSVDLLLDGVNPFTASMAPASEHFGTDLLHVTPTIDGGEVSSASYPAGAFLWFLPEAMILGVSNFMWTLLAFAVITLGFLIVESPAELAMAPIVVMVGSRNLIWTSVGGLIDILWLVPLLLAMREWHADRRGRSAFAFGIAAATKQQVWPIAPFLAVWLYAESESHADFMRQAKTTLSHGSAGFLLFNLPFMLWSPTGWVFSVLTPVAGGPQLVEQGIGLVTVSMAGIYALPSSFFTIMVAGAAIVGLVLYALYWDRLKWVAWIAPPLIFWFHYRSLMSYFTYFAPVAYYALLCAIDARGWQLSWPAAPNFRGEAT